MDVKMSVVVFCVVTCCSLVGGYHGIPYTLHKVIRYLVLLTVVKA
jgi:Na+(H+)/acetate symporter ActP